MIVKGERSLLPGFEDQGAEHDQGNDDDDEPLANHWLVNGHEAPELLEPGSKNLSTHTVTWWTGDSTR